MKHEILEGVWRVRDQISAECGYDLKKLVARRRRLEAKHADRVVAYAPRKWKATMAKVGKPVRNRGAATGA